MFVNIDTVYERIGADHDLSTIVLFMSKKHDDQYGAKSNYGRTLENGGNIPEAEAEAKPITM